MVLYVRSWYGMGAFYRWVLSADGPYAYCKLFPPPYPVDVIQPCFKRKSVDIVSLRFESIQVKDGRWKVPKQFVALIT